MSRKITLIEYDDDIYAGDDMDADIANISSYNSALGGKTAEQSAAEIEAERIDAQVEAQLSGLHDYLIGISSSSSSSSSSSAGSVSFSSSSQSSSSSSSSLSSSSLSSSSESYSSQSSSSSSSSFSSSSSSSSVVPITIGPGATDRNGFIDPGYTIICLGNPAAGSGILTSVEIWAFTDISGLRIGTFYNDGGVTFVCRDSESIGNVVSGSKQIFEVSINVQQGDYLGAYWLTGQMERSTEGEDGYYYVSGEYIDPSDSQDYTLTADRAISIYAES